MSDELEKIVLPGPIWARDKAATILSEAADRDLAVAEVELLSRQFFQWLHHELNSPRPSNLRREIVNIAEGAKVLERALRSSSELALFEIASLGSGYALYPEAHELDFFRVGDIEGLLKAGNNDSDWVSRLSALSLALKTTLRHFDDRNPTDKGGKKNVFSQASGSAKWNLVRQGRDVFDAFRPGDATGTVLGDFHKFLMHVFEYTTGRNANKHSMLESLVKGMAPICRAVSSAEEEAFELETERDSLCRVAVNGRRNATRLKEIALRLEELDAVKARLQEQLRKVS